MTEEQGLKPPGGHPWPVLYSPELVSSSLKFKYLSQQIKLSLSLVQRRVPHTPRVSLLGKSAIPPEKGSGKYNFSILLYLQRCFR